jgi:hypothetical protein
MYLKIIQRFLKNLDARISEMEARISALTAQIERIVEGCGDPARLILEQYNEIEIESCIMTLS